MEPLLKYWSRAGWETALGESFVQEGEFLCALVPDQAPLCFFVWFVVFSSGAFGTPERMFSGNAGTWNSCPFLPSSVQTDPGG